MSELQVAVKKVCDATLLVDNARRYWWTPKGRQNCKHTRLLDKLPWVLQLE
jgi:hypothetical protein